MFSNRIIFSWPALDLGLTVELLEEHDFTKCALRVGCIVERIEDLNQPMHTFFSATICFSFLSTAFHTIP